MTRIVAGTAGGRRIAVPPRGTRPTAERVREAIFSAVTARIDLAGTRVLDLYAGSGALGIEALSRGAGHAVFVESDRAAAGVLRRNLANLGLTGAGQLRQQPVDAVLAGRPDAGYHLVLADPPYDLDAAALDRALAALAGNGWLAPGALVVVERAAGSAEPGWPEGVESVTARRYGDTVVCYGRRP